MSKRLILELLEAARWRHVNDGIEGIIGEEWKSPL